MFHIYFFQLSGVTQYVDLSVLYGSDEWAAPFLRKHIGGLMLEDISYKVPIAPVTHEATPVCIIPSKEHICLVAGNSYALTI